MTPRRTSRPLVVLAATALAACLSTRGLASSDAEVDLPPEPISRVALVIGEEHYAPPLDPVTNAISDSTALAALLATLDFDIVWHIPDAPRETINDYMSALAQYTSRPGQPVFAVVFFAGHGSNRQGYDYVSPIGADAADDSDIPLTHLIATLASPPAQGGILLFLVDACRTAEAGEGHAAPKPVILSLATRMNWTAASTGTQRDHSPYAAALLQHLPTPGASIASVLDSVSIQVREWDDLQAPEMLSLAGATPTRAFLKRTATQVSEEKEAWTLAQRGGRWSCVQRFIDTHPDGVFLKSALRWQSAQHASELKSQPPCTDR